MKWGVFMKIINNKAQRIAQIYRKQEISKQDKKTSGVKKRDEFKLSSEAKDFQVAMQALRNTSDVRKDKIAEIKRQVEAGTYEMDSGKIVEKIISDLNTEMKV